jgi:RNA polymerase sigma-70 factor (ECF subfamily)
MDIDVRRAAAEHFARLRRAALVLTGSPWDADDLAQETFLVLAGDGRRFEGRSRLYTYLYGVLLNLDRRRRRRQGLDRRKLRVLWDDDAPHEAATPAETPLEIAEWKRSLWAVVAQLPDGQRQALVLRYAEGLSYREIAEAMACPLGTVKSRIFNGLAAVRELLAAEPSHAAFPRRAPPWRDRAQPGNEGLIDAV